MADRPPLDHPETEMQDLNSSGRRLETESTQYSQKCLCKTSPKCPKVPETLFYRKGDVVGILDAPFKYGSPAHARSVGRRIACQYRLGNLAHVFEKAALLIKNPKLVDQEPAPQRVEHAPSPEDARMAEPQRHGQGLEGPADRQDRRSGREDNIEPHGSVQHRDTSASHAFALSKNERIALLNENRLGFWDQSWPFRATAFMLFIAAVVQGWNQTATNGANLCWLDPLIASGQHNITAGSECVSSSGYTAQYAIINAGPFLFAPIGCILADPLNEFLMGRRHAMFVSAVIILGAAIGGAFTQRWWQLLICRALLGVGMGGKASVTPVFAAEIAPPQLRGTLIMNWQVFDALGIFLGFTANLVAASAGLENAWRWQVASSLLPAFALILAVTLICWDSPRFLMRHEQAYQRRFDNKKIAHDRLLAKRRQSLNRETNGSESQDEAPNELSFLYQVWSSIRYAYGPNPAYEYHSKAFDTLVILRGNELLAAKELVFTHCQMITQRLAVQERSESGKGPEDDVDFSLKPQRDFLNRYYNLIFKGGYLTRETAAAVTGMVGQQLCGINVLIFYSSRLFTRAGQGNSNPSYSILSRSPVWLSWGIGLANFLFALPAYWWIESRGRRWLALSTLPFLAIMMAGAAASFTYGDENSDDRKAAVGVFAILFTIFYSPGMGPVPFTLAAEVFPLDYRIMGMSIASMINFLLGGAFAVMVPFVTKEYILLGIFAGLNVVAWILVWIFVREPETVPDNKNSSATYLRLEEMFHIYEPSHYMHMKYQWGRKGEALRGFGEFWIGKRSGKKEYFREWYDRVTDPGDNDSGQSR